MKLAVRGQGRLANIDPTAWAHLCHWSIRMPGIDRPTNPHLGPLMFLTGDQRFPDDSHPSMGRGATCGMYIVHAPNKKKWRTEVETILLLHDSLLVIPFPAAAEMQSMSYHPSLLHPNQWKLCCLLPSGLASSCCLLSTSFRAAPATISRVPFLSISKSW